MTQEQESLVEEQLLRISTREPLVRAWAWHDPEQVRRQLALLPTDTTNLPLAGVTVGIKDIFDTFDMPTSYGSTIFANHRPDKDAAVVAKLRAAGAVIMGKTVTAEFAYSLPGPTSNPFCIDRTPGLSSSGSAAAVADGMVTMAIASQTGGSTIAPAAFCGVVGFKPSYGKVSLEGVRPLSVTQDTVGLMAKSMSDIHRLSSVLLDDYSTVSPPSKIRVAWYPSPYAKQADKDAIIALKQARERLSAAGVEIASIELPEGEFLALGLSNRHILAYDAARSYREIYRSRVTELSESMIQLIETGLQITDEQFLNELAHVEKCRRIFAKAMVGIDTILTFSALGIAPLKTTGTGATIFNRVWTTLGAPCLNIPFGLGDQGLPLGVHFIAPIGKDNHLLSLGTRFESIFG